MATITLKYDAHNSIARKALDLLLSLKIFVVDEHTDELKKSIEDVEAGKTYKAKDAKDLMRKIYG
ncbi:MAG: hypothetical protein ACFN40_05210 [Bacteroidota bacterium]|jgi:hypothetical protein|nr:conserved hypothetical protein [Bacteroidetes oral taxon 274 str. F0058]